MIHLVSPLGLEAWDHRNPDGPGIGGSETAHVEMDKYLRGAGYAVANWAPIAEETPGWRKVADFNPEHYHGDIIIVSRGSDVFNRFNCPKDNKYWFVAQDCDAPWSPEGIERVDRFLALCDMHVTYTRKRYPMLEGRLFKSSNGIRVADMEALEASFAVKRNPKRVIYASSPDRGLVQLLRSWPRVSEYVPDAELHVFYGFNNVKACIEAGNKELETLVADVDRALNNPVLDKVHIHGRKGQKELWKEYLASGIWWYPTNWPETSCISCMEAQALGAIPVTSAIWATGQNVFFGAMTDGTPQGDPSAAAEQIHHMVDLMRHPEIQDQIRAEMMPFTRKVFDWRNIGQQWEAWIKQDLAALESCQAHGC